MFSILQRIVQSKKRHTHSFKETSTYFEVQKRVLTVTLTCHGCHTMHTYQLRSDDGRLYAAVNPDIYADEGILRIAINKRK